MVFGFLGHRTNWGTALIGDKSSTKTREIGNFTFQSPLFLCSFTNKRCDFNGIKSELWLSKRYEMTFEII